MREVNWAENVTYQAVAIHHPTSVDEVRQIVARADRIHALGTRHSFNDIADAPELVCLDQIDPQVEINHDQMTVSVGAGIRYGVLAATLEREGLALHNMGSLPHISIGGATATATHGSGDRNRNLSSAICGLELVTSDGDLVTVTRDHDDFAGMVVHLGALGIVTRLTLDLQPSYMVCQDVSEELPWPDITERFDELFSSAYSVSVFTSFRDQAGVLWRKHRLTDGRGPEDIVRWNARASVVHRHPVDDLSGDACTPQLLEPGPWCERLPHFRLDQVPASGAEIQSEYFVDRLAAPQVIDALRDFEPRMRDLLMISEIRTVAADDLWLSTATDRDTVAFHFSWFLNPAEVDTLLPELEAMLAPFAARPHWGKVFAMTGQELETMYPQYDAFRRLRRKLDPRDAFLSPYVERVGLV